MKNTMTRVVAFMLVMMVSVGCATKLERARNNIQGTWRIDKVLENGQDITTAYLSNRVNYRITFDGDNGFQERYLLFAGGDEVNVSGTWDFSNNAEQLTLADGNQSRVYQVDRLEEGVFNVTDRTTNNARQIEFRPN